MTCEELLKALNEYVDGAELTEICEEFGEHLAGCNPCQVVVDNIRQTIALYKAGGVWTAEYFPVLREPLIELASSYLRRPDRLTMAENRDITAEEVVERFFIGNTVEFLRKFF